MADIELQLAGGKLEHPVQPEKVHASPERRHLLETIMALPGSNLMDELARRNAAILAVMAYYSDEEGGPKRRTR